MAEKKTNTTPTEEEAVVTSNKKDPFELVKVMLPLPSDPKAPRDEFFSVNGKNWLIRRGEWVQVPRYLKEVIDNSQEAQRAAYNYVNEVALREPTQR